MITTPLLALATILGQAYSSALPTVAPIIGESEIAARAPNEKVTIISQSPELAALLAKVGKREVFKDGIEVDDRTLVQVITDRTKTASIGKPAPFKDDKARGGRETTCPREIFYCHGHLLWLRQSLVSIESVGVSINNNIEDSVRAEGAASIGLKITSTTAKAKSSTSGWNVGGKISVSAGDGTMEISGGYSSSTTELVTETRAQEHSITCPPRTECRLVTRTFTTTVNGICEDLPTVNCRSGNVMMCENPKQWEKTCPDYQTHAAKCNNRQKSPCSFSFPVLDSKGKLLQQVVAMTTSL
ncbi:hypothetical protein LOZ53_003947 [Ophidiomyces ophidiicola]|uniref:Uncharacterized protein n=1 Tax=Ophidiomyces ophidiicola TaxID=1387563 RepID=A0ACB8V0M9_9EURO|nr:uncharacterized protein LOZ57_004548 [Ophidiomyces ophidiicola]KAI1917631.1 hypothetical protein LOZ61_000250 [Ophidiomyces ophidiicola]KAI1923930.1 hypothetical protein LOZ60_004931 [Ophidiomyces ophidiicola]KAI1944876.1 hypothetical protein LOZ57_004548 [Ophidiomyces ophidiicola]KAI1952373.1 hypothetical protein LOZ62_001321 [Ophidiomyces ophidiicola]KAI1960853.1 hypothetical protein LOZ59_002548 [Ophidiomyces ophidiicola]